MLETTFINNFNKAINQNVSDILCTTEANPNNSVFNINELIKVKKLLDSYKPEYHYIIPRFYYDELKSKVDNKTATLEEIKTFNMLNESIKYGDVYVSPYVVEFAKIKIPENYNPYSFSTELA